MVTSHQKILTCIQESQSRSEECYKRARDLAKESRDALAEAQTLRSTLSKAGAALGGTPDGQEPPTRAAAPWKESESDSDMDIESDSDFEEQEAKRSKPSARPRPTVNAARHRHGQPSAASKTPTRGKKNASNDTEDEAWEDHQIDALMAELAQHERDLHALARDVNEAAMREAVDVHTNIIQMQSECQAQEAKSQELGLKLVAARTARYHRFSSAMDTAAQILSLIFQRLTGGIGDAHCQYPKDEDAAFEVGVKFMVRPDNGSWRSFAALSGGQQALAALALCLAFQAVAPSPFYFFDEIDAALDVINARNLAQFLKEACDVQQWIENGSNGPMPPQIVAVSHRPPVQEASDVLVAVVTAKHIDQLTLYTQTLTIPKKGYEGDGDQLSFVVTGMQGDDGHVAIMHPMTMMMQNPE